MFTAPTLEEVRRFVDNGFSKAFYGTSGALRVSVLKILSYVVAGAVYMPILLCKKIFKNAFVSTCDVNFLDSPHGVRLSLPHKPASFAHGMVLVSGAAGSVIPSGTKVKDSSSGNEYEFIGSATVASNGFVHARVKAVNVGSEYNLDANVVLEFSESAPSGITEVSSMVLNGGSKVSVDLGDRVEEWGETAEEYRARLLQREQNQPQGGSAPDWYGWVMRFNTVNNCWVDPNWPYSNSVTLFVNNTSNSGGTVLQEDVDEIQDYVDNNERRPITSRPSVVACQSSILSMKISAAGYSEVVKENILNSLKNYLKSFGPGKTISVAVLNDIVRAVGGDQSAMLSDVKVDGVAKVGSFTLLKSFVNGVIVGKVIDINNIQINWVRA